MYFHKGGKKSQTIMILPNSAKVMICIVKTPFEFARNIQVHL